MELVLVRHGQSEWNRLNLFTGWHDIGLSELGRQEALECGRQLCSERYDFDICYTSYLKRAIHTLNIILEVMDRDWLPVQKSWRLNERHYGALQGLDKAETAREYGDDQVKIWRRSFDTPPPELTPDDPRNPRLQAQYRYEEKPLLPLTESLKTTIDRTVPYFREVIEPEIREGKRVLISSHGNTLRALVMYFENITPEEIMELNIPTGVPLVYEFDRKFCVTGKRYCDPEAIRERTARAESVGKDAGQKNMSGTPS